MQNLKYPIGEFDAQDPRWHLDKSENINYISNFPALLWDAIEPLTDDQMQTPYRPDGWTITQLVHHIADSHINAYIRFKLSLTENEPTIKVYEEKDWAELPDNNLELIGASIQLTKALHIKWAGLMENMSDKDWTKRYYHPADDSYVDLVTARRMYHWHSAHHLAHITNLIERQNW